jgi:hypothetical protein
MNYIYDKIIERLQQSVDRPSITKLFKFSIEELQDNPDRLKEIADHLKLHEGKYTDFDLHTWIDPDTFKPVFMLQMFLNEDFKRHIVSTRTEKTIQYFSNQKD